VTLSHLSDSELGGGQIYQLLETKSKELICASNKNMTKNVTYFINGAIKFKMPRTLLRSLSRIHLVEHRFRSNRECHTNGGVSTISQ